MITLVMGYPGSGKTTWARRQAEECAGYLVDLDILAEAVSQTEPHASALSDTKGAIAHIRWELCRVLEGTGRDVFLTVAYLRLPDWEQHARFCARVYMDTPRDVCRNRARKRGDYSDDSFERACRLCDETMRMFGQKFRRVAT